MEFGLGGLRLAPRDFWTMTLREYDRAVAGYAKSRGASAGKRMSRSRLQEMIDLDKAGLLAKWGARSELPKDTHP